MLLNPSVWKSETTKKEKFYEMKISYIILFFLITHRFDFNDFDGNISDFLIFLPFLPFVHLANCSTA